VEPADRARPRVGAGVPRPLAPRQGRPLHTRGQLHGLVLVERVRQGRADHLGEPGCRLPADRPRPPEPRAPRLPARGVVLLVHVLAGSSQAPVHPGQPARALAGGEGGGAGPGDGVRAGRGRRRLPGRARPRRLRALLVGRGDRADRRRDRAHDRRARSRPGRRLHADPRDVTRVVHVGHALSQPDRRPHDHVLRLVRGPAAGVAADVRRPDRRARVRGLVGRELPDHLGHEPADHAHAGRALHDRGALPRPEGRGRLARLQRPRQVRRRLAARPAGHRRGAGDGDGPRAAQGVLGRPHHAAFCRLQPALHGPAAARDARPARRRHLRPRPLRDGVRPRRHVRERGLEARRPRRHHERAENPERRRRLPLRGGGQGPLEPAPGGPGPGAHPARARRRHGPAAAVRHGQRRDDARRAGRHRRRPHGPRSWT
jgi:hypothetical protein